MLRYSAKVQVRFDFFFINFGVSLFWKKINTQRIVAKHRNGRKRRIIKNY